MWLFAGVAFAAHRIGRGQVAALFGQKVKEDLRCRHATLDGGCTQPCLPLLVDKDVDIADRDLVPGLAATCSKLAHIADIIDRRTPIRRPTPQMLFKGPNSSKRSMS